MERKEKFIRERKKLKKKAGRRTLSEKNAKTGAQKKKLECFPGRVCEEGGGEGKKEGTNQKECV